MLVGMDGETTQDEERDAGVLSGLPRARPQRRSERRPTSAPAAPASKPRPKAASGRPKAVRATASKAKVARPVAPRLKQPAQPSGVPPQPTPDAEKRRPAQGPEGVVVAAVQAAEEVARLGAAVGGQLVKGALRRIPRP
jgi:hypothetical protein